MRQSDREYAREMRRSKEYWNAPEGRATLASVIYGEMPLMHGVSGRSTRPVDDAVRRNEEMIDAVDPQCLTPSETEFVKHDLKWAAMTPEETVTNSLDLGELYPEERIAGKTLGCVDCNAEFKSVAELMEHEASSGHGSCKECLNRDECNQDNDPKTCRDFEQAWDGKIHKAKQIIAVTTIFGTEAMILCDEHAAKGVAMGGTKLMMVPDPWDALCQECCRLAGEREMKSGLGALGALGNL